MKGVILAGGLGTRLNPCTLVTNKHLLPVYDKPMIYYPLETLVRAGIKDIMIVTGGPFAGDFLRLLGNGEQFGLKHINYTYQEGEGGIAEALSLAEYFVAGEKVCVILGDNLIENNIVHAVNDFHNQSKGAKVLLKQVEDAERFGVAEIVGDKIVSIEEKPKKPKSHYAVTGIYFYDSQVFDFIKGLSPSDRGELEITDVNNLYIKHSTLSYNFLEGWWTDAGTFNSLLRATNLVAESGANKLEEKGNKVMRLLITGGAGFIGSNFTRWILANEPKLEKAVVLDLLTYAGNLENLADLRSDSRFVFERGDIRDDKLIAKIIGEQEITTVVNFAAESHVDRSIIDPLSFVRTNVEGTQVLLNVCRELDIKRYVQISTDEVYGSLGPEGRFTETTPLDPSSAYSASKTSGDLLTIAAYRTHKFPAIVTRCSNNYGPYQFPEKLIPLFITNALQNQPLPLYGDGLNIRSWRHVDDHSRAITAVIKGGKPGEVYNIGGAPEAERTNANVTDSVLKILDKPKDLIKPVEDRKGHDRRYAVDYSKIKQELGWEPTVKFNEGLKLTVDWYINNKSWWEKIKSGEYQRFYELYYSDRLKQA